MEARTRPLVEALSGSGLPDRQQLILSLAPGCLFGFPPKNLVGIIERVDCPTCRELMGVAQHITEIGKDLHARIGEFQRSTVERNGARRAEYRRRAQRPIIGRFAREPRDEPLPDAAQEPWYRELREHVRELERHFEELRASCSTHWQDPAAREVSDEVVSGFLLREHHHMTT